MGFLSFLVTMDSLLHEYSPINHHAAIESQAVIVEFRKVFCFRK